MKRVAIPEITALPFQDQVNIFRHVFENKHTINGIQKMDGIFLSVGIDLDNELFFQTANSPPITNRHDYLHWSRNQTFAYEIANLIDIAVKNVEFQRMVRVHFAQGYPDAKDLTFEFFPKKYQWNYDEERAITIKIPHMKYMRDTIIFHDPSVFMALTKFIPKQGASFPYTVLTAFEEYPTFSPKAGFTAYELLREHNFEINSRSPSLKAVRDFVKAGIKIYFNTFDIGIPDNDYIFEGIVCTFEGIRFKIRDPRSLEFTKLNPLIFGDK